MILNYKIQVIPPKNNLFFIDLTLQKQDYPHHLVQYFTSYSHIYHTNQMIEDIFTFNTKSQYGLIL